MLKNYIALQILRYWIALQIDIILYPTLRKYVYFVFFNILSVQNGVSNRKKKRFSCRLNDLGGGD